MNVTTIIIGITETSQNTWRVTRNGKVLGDSRGHDREGALQAARKEITGNVIDTGDWVSGVWVECPRIKILDAAI